jgi:predicted nuclease of predicted toxin-antitoxin system
VKLPLDQNLSPRLCQLLADLDATVVHVRDVRLHAADDAAIWDYALREGFMIVTKDSDFNSRAFLLGRRRRSSQSGLATVQPATSSCCCVPRLQRWGTLRLILLLPCSLSSSLASSSHLVTER